MNASRSIVTASLLWTVFVAFLGQSASLTVWGAEKQTQRLEDIEAHLSREKRRLDALGLKEKDLLSELSDLQEQVKSGEDRLNKIENDLKETNKQIIKLKKSLEHNEIALDEITHRLNLRLSTFYKFLREGYLKVVIASSDIWNLLHQVKYLKAIIREDGRNIEALAETSAVYEGGIQRLMKALDAAKRRSEEAQRQAEPMQKELEDRVVELMKVHQEKQYYEKAVRELELAARDMKSKLGNMKKLDLGAPEMAFADFERSKGKLPPPLTGEIVTLRNSSSKGALNLRKGVFIRGNENEVKAVFAGRVDFSGSLKGYGDMIIVNHGGRYYTVMGQLTERRKQAGEWVKAGDVVGRVANGGPLYFEIREGTENVDPLEWFGGPGADG